MPFLSNVIVPLTLGLLQAPPVQTPRSQPTASAQPTTTAAPATSTPVAQPEAPPSLPSDPAAAPDPFTTPSATAEPAPTQPPTTDGIFYMSDAEPLAPAQQPDAAPAAAVEELKYRRLVFSNLYTLNMGLFPIPSGDLSVFLGTNLRPRRSSLGTDWNTALGYQMTLSLGYADYWYGDESNAVQNDRCDEFDFCNPEPIFYHRHALMAQGHGGRKGRLYYALGGGAVLWNSRLIGIEAEGRIGYVFSQREGSRVKGVLGGQARLGGAFEGVPRPQFGFFIGFMVF